MASRFLGLPPLYLSSQSGGQRSRSPKLAIERKIDHQHIDSRFAQDAERSAFNVRIDHSFHALGVIPRAFATRGNCQSIASGDRCGSSPLADVVTSSAGMGPVASGFSLFRRLRSSLIRSCNFFEVGPRFDPPKQSRRSPSRLPPRAGAGNRPGWKILDRSAPSRRLVPVHPSRDCRLLAKGRAAERVR